MELRTDVLLLLNKTRNRKVTNNSSESSEFKGPHAPQRNHHRKGSMQIKPEIWLLMGWGFFSIPQYCWLMVWNIFCFEILIEPYYNKDKGIQKFPWGATSLHHQSHPEQQYLEIRLAGNDYIRLWQLIFSSFGTREQFLDFQQNNSKACICNKYRLSVLY